MSVAGKSYVQRSERASGAVARGLIWTGLIACVLGSALYDLWMIHWSARRGVPSVFDAVCRGQNAFPRFLTVDGAGLPPIK